MFCDVGMEGAEERLSVPFPPLVCGPPRTFFDVMLCEFRDREGMEMFCRVKKNQSRTSEMKDHPSALGGRRVLKWVQLESERRVGQQKREHVQITCVITFDLEEKQLKSVYL